MKSIYEKENKRLTFEIHEEIDEYVVQNMRRRIDNEIERYMPKEVIFDFNKVSFMDSAGIGLIIGRYKLASMLGGKVEVTNLTVQVRKIFEMSGILKIIPEVKCTEKKRSQVCNARKKSDLRCAGGKI
ncbi:anti-sigma F factor antagonist [Clostridium sp. CAG:356]|nr:anti-sigma F factor antagonist [Clostridium sp. CAG:356]